MESALSLVLGMTAAGLLALCAEPLLRRLQGPSSFAPVFGEPAAMPALEAGLARLDERQRRDLEKTIQSFSEELGRFQVRAGSLEPTWSLFLNQSRMFTEEHLRHRPSHLWWAVSGFFEFERTLRSALGELGATHLAASRVLFSFKEPKLGEMAEVVRELERLRAQAEASQAAEPPIVRTEGTEESERRG